MKTTMKMMAVMAVMMGFAFSAMGQTANDGITASATVVDAISVEDEQNLNFGQVSVNVNKSVDINGTATSTADGTSDEGVKVGQFKVFAGAGSNVILDFELPATLAGPSANMPIVYTQDHAGSAKNFAAYGLNLDASGTTTRFDPNSSVNVGSGTFPTNTVDSKNGIYVYIGGTVQPASDQVTGSYTGTITLTATYN